MGIFKKLFSGKKKERTEGVTIEPEMEESGLFDKSRLTEEVLAQETADTPDTPVDLEQAAEPKSFIKDNCEQIVEATRQLEELKAEYQAVTSYLTDIQKIELIPSEEREDINEIARKIITFTRERAKYQSSSKNITDVQLKHLEKFEDVLPKELKQMKENEDYNNTIKTDLKHLEGEKGALFYQKEEILNKQNYLKRIAIVTSGLVLILFALFVLIHNATQTDMQVPFLMTVIMALGSAAYIFISSRNNRRDMKITELKLNKAINLQNKVKIKYINNTNALEYSYQKYMVNSHTELNYLWEQYLKAKEEEKSYRSNSEQLERYNRELIVQLRVYGLEDPDIWKFQAIAILDSKEMVEVRHRLNQRRQKLRDRIDYNNKLKDKSVAALTAMLEKKPEKREEVTVALRKFGIYLE